MKKIFLLLTIFLVFQACEKHVVHYDDNPYGYPELEISQPVDDITVEEGIIEYGIDISGVFVVVGEENAIILKSVRSNSNTSLLTATVNGDSVLLDVNIGETGTATIELRAEYGIENEVTVLYESFDFSVTPKSSQQCMENAIACFQSDDYKNAAIYFELVVVKNNTEHLSNGYLGLGFSRMRLSDAFEAYQALQSSITVNNQNTDAKAGLTLLEYAFQHNYTEAVRLGNEVLATDNNYEFIWDNSIDHYDMLVTIALSYYSLQDFENCLLTIQQIEPTFDLDSADPQFMTKLLQKLEELVNNYS